MLSDLASSAEYPEEKKAEDWEGCRATNRRGMP